jgi:hypothetical protein
MQQHEIFKFFLCVLTQGFFSSKGGKDLVNKYFELFFTLTKMLFVNFVSNSFLEGSALVSHGFTKVCVCKDTSHGYIQRVMNDLYRTRLSLHRMIWLLPHPLPPFPSVSSTGGTQEDWERETTCWRGRWGMGRSQIIQRWESLVLYKSFNTLWLFWSVLGSCLKRPEMCHFSLLHILPREQLPKLLYPL